MIPRYQTPLDAVMAGLEQRKLNFDREELKGLLFERVCQEAEIEGEPLTREYISQRMVRYSCDILMCLDDIYNCYDKDLWLDKDANGCYWVSDYPPKRS